MDIRLYSYIADGGEAGRNLQEIEDFFEMKRNRPTSLDIQTSLNTMLNRQTITFEGGRYKMKEVAPRCRKGVESKTKVDSQSIPMSHPTGSFWFYGTSTLTI